MAALLNMPKEEEEKKERSIRTPPHWNKAGKKGTDRSNTR
jgi:hypothetical protein